MHIESYDYITGQSLGNTSLSINFGDLIQGQHCTKPIVIRTIADSSDSTNIYNLRLFLENKGSWKSTEYGYFINETFISSIESGSNSFSNHFTEVPGASSTSIGGIPIKWLNGSSSYIWLDAHIHDSTGMINANFRLFYDF